MEKTHVRKLRNPNYIGSYELSKDNDTFNDLDVVIDYVISEDVQNGDKKEPCTVIHLKGFKPFILNTTNEKRIIKLFGTPFIEDWVGRSFTLYVEKVRAFGELHDALRVRRVLPKDKKKPIAPERFKLACEKIKTGDYTKDKLMETSALTDDQLNELKKI